MSNRKRFSSKQVVKAKQLNEAFDDAEDGERSIAAGFQFTGVHWGLDAEQDDPPSLTVVVSPGLAFTKLGSRVLVEDPQLVDMSADDDGQSTNPAFGNERYVAVFARQARKESQPIGPDLLGNMVPFEHDEWFDLVVVRGPEVAAGTAQPIQPDEDDVLLFDVLFTSMKSTITTAEILYERTESMVDFESLILPGWELWKLGPRDAMEAIFQKVGELGSGEGLYTLAAPVWANAATVTGTANPNNTFNNYTKGIVEDLASTTGVGGTARVGGAQFTTGSVTTPAGTLLSQLQAIGDASGVNIAASGTWGDGAYVSPQESVEARVNDIIARLAVTSNTDGGARYVAMRTGQGNFGAKNTVLDWLLALAHSSSPTANGAYFVSFWSDGLAGFSGVNDTYSAIVQFTRTDAASDGASHVGTEAKGGLSGANVRAQFDEIDVGWGKLDRENEWSAEQTFDDVDVGGDINVDGALDVAGHIKRTGTTTSDIYRWTTMPDEDATIDVSFDEWVLPNTRGPPGSEPDREITLRETTAPIPEEGARIRLVQTPNRINGAVLKKETAPGVNILTLAAGGWASVEFTFRSGTWRLSMGGGAITITDFASV